MKKEMMRQTLHILMGLVIVVLLNFDMIGTRFFVVCLLFGILLSVACRLYSVPFFSRALDLMEREREDIPGRGVIFYFLGSLLVWLLFEKNIALASIMILALGDSISVIVGKYHAKKKKIENKKLIEGWAAGIIAGSLGAWIFVPFLYGFASALIAMTIETIKLGTFDKVLDDNLYVPLISGLIIYLLIAL